MGTSEKGLCPFIQSTNMQLYLRHCVGCYSVSGQIFHHSLPAYFRWNHSRSCGSDESPLPAPVLDHMVLACPIIVLLMPLGTLTGSGMSTWHKMIQSGWIQGSVWQLQENNLLFHQTQTWKTWRYCQPYCHYVESENSCLKARGRRNAWAGSQSNFLWIFLYVRQLTPYFA